MENHILAILGLWLPADVAGANTLRITAYVSSFVVFARRRPVDSRTYPASPVTERGAEGRQPPGKKNNPEPVQAWEREARSVWNNVGTR